MALPIHEDDNVVPLAPKPSASVVVVTPEMAHRWLKQNTRNRPTKKRQIEVYARDMAAGRWQLTGEAIKFSTSGVLLDGQNRLHAVIKAGVPVLMFVARGLDVGAQTVMDTGAKRSASDALHLNGRTNSANLAAAARLALGVKAVGYDRASRYNVSNSEIENFLDTNPDMARAVQLGVEYHRKLDCIPAVTSYATWRFLRIDEGDALRFLIAAGDKSGLYEGDPTIAMTYRFAEARRSGTKLSHADYLSVMFRAWNARRKGEQVRLIRVNSSTGNRVAVPEPK